MGRFCEGLGTSSIGQASWSFQTLDFASGTKRNSCHPLLSLSYVSGSLQRARHVMGHPNITSLLDDHFHPECNDRLAWIYQSRTTHRDTLICFDKQMIIFSRVDGAQLYSLSIWQIHLGFTNLEILFNESQSQTSAVADGAVLIPRAVYKHSNSWGGSGYRILDQKFASGTFSLSPLWQSVIQPNPTQPSRFTLVGLTLSYSYGLPRWLLFVICKASSGEKWHCPTLPWMSIYSKFPDQT
jgi:hypothetical protein